MSVHQNIVAIYCRLSKEDYDKLLGDESESIQNQKLLLMDYATQNDFIVYKIYADEDFSGFSDRPQFKKMITDAQKGLFNIVLCKHQSRFTRDMELVERYIHGSFVEWGIRFISITDNVDTNVKGNKKARQIYGLINEWYSEDLSENIKATLRKKMEDKQFLGAFACYGYKKDPKDHHKIIIDEEAAEVVREIFSLYLQGYGVVKIASTLTERGILPPTLYKKNQGLNFLNNQKFGYSEKYGAWSSNTLRTMLDNVAYIGTLAQGRFKKVSYKSSKMVATNEEEWIVHKNNHEAIIDEQAFYNIQNMRKHKRTHYGNNFEGEKGEYVRPHLLAGKVVCSDCGSTMQRNGRSKDGKTRYLRCKCATVTKSVKCTSHCIRQDVIEKTILTKIQTLMESTISAKDHDDILDQVCKKLSGNQKDHELIEKKLFEIEGKLKAIQRNIMLAYSDKLEGIISETEFFDFRNMFEEERKALHSKKAQLEQDKKIFATKTKSKESIRSLLTKYKPLDVLTHEIINDFVYSVHIGEKNRETGEQEITINWTF